MRYTTSEKKKLLAEVKKHYVPGKVSLAKACKKAKLSLPTYYLWKNKGRSNDVMKTAKSINKRYGKMMKNLAK